MLTVENLCPYIIRLIHAPVHVYDSGGTPTAVYIDYGEQQDILDSDKEFSRRLLESKNPDCPYLYLEAEELAWGVAANDRQCYIMGPCCISPDAARAARAAIARHGMDSKLPYHVHHVPLNLFCEILRMLFEGLTGKKVSMGALYLNSFRDEKFERELRKKVADVFYELRENATVHNPYSQELLEQESIRNGDLDALKRSFEIPYVGKIGTLSRDPLRHAKNIDIVLITLACRSAIAGGLLPEIAFSMSDAFIQRVEELDNLGEVAALGRQAEIEYCEAVREMSSGKRRHPAVERCKELIFQRMHTKISIAELAERLNLHPDYLSRIFSKEEGVRLSDYIAREKIRFAKEQLIYTNHSYNEIAASLGFSSQSHFGQAFKKYSGMTPKEFRDGKSKKKK